MKTYDIETDSDVILKAMAIEGTIVDVSLKFSLFQWKWMYKIKFVYKEYKFNMDVLNARIEKLKADRNK